MTLAISVALSSCVMCETAVVAEDGGVEADAGTDTGPEVDSGIPKPRCIEDWPDASFAEPVAPLAVTAPAVKWRKSVGWLGSPSVTLAGDRLAVMGGNKLWIFDLDGNVVAEVPEFTSFTGGDPIADEDGNFIFATSKLTSVTPDGGFRWQVPLGPNRGSNETTWTSRLILSPEGVIHFHATDGLLYGVRASDGKVMWTRPMALDEWHPQSIGAGAGDTFVVGGIFHESSTGKPSGGVVHDGHLIAAGAAAWDGLLGSYFDHEAYELRGYFLDRCGEVLWSLPNVDGAWGANLVGFDGRILVRHAADKLYWYSPEGAPLLGPKPARGWPMLLGADGVIYAKQCSDNTAASDYVLTAYDANLEELWSINAGPPCGWGPIALGQDGVVYSAASGSNGMEIVAIQTTSPGLAPTAWPALFHDNQRTDWLR